jgi:hypothetical protein
MKTPRRSPGCALLALLLLPTSPACDDGPSELDEFRKEIGQVGLSRVVIARMYQRGKWVIGAVPDDAPHAAKIAYVCDAIAPLEPTYVSGLVRLDGDNDEGKKMDEMVAVFKGVKDCIRDRLEKKHGNKARKVRYDVVLNAQHYTGESEKNGKVMSKGEGYAKLEARLETANLLEPDGYFFDFFSVPWAPWIEEVHHPEALEKGIALIHKQDRFVGGNVLGRIIPSGSDFVAITDRGGYDDVKIHADKLASEKPDMPVLLHIRNDPHCDGSEGRLYVERTTKWRKQVLRRHIDWEREFGFTYMYPVFFPLHKPNANKEDCDRKGFHEPPADDDGDAFDATTDSDLIERMKHYLGAPADGKGGAMERPAVSDEDAVPTVFDAGDDGLIPIHRATHPVEQRQVLAPSLHAIDEDTSIDLELETYFSLARTPAPGTVPLHRCDAGAGHSFVTTDPACEGSGSDLGVVGFIADTPLAGTVPLHRLVRGDGTDHLYTTSAPERDAAVAGGYTYEKIAGHVWDELGYAVAEVPPADPMAPPPAPALPCDPPLQPVYKGYHPKRGQHLFAIDHDELLVPMMIDEGIAFHLKPAPAPDPRWVAFFRCVMPQTWHLLTVDPACEGLQDSFNEGALGNLATTALPGTVALYRYFHPGPDGKHDHFYVTGTACEAIAGYTCDGSVGYVCP